MFISYCVCLKCRGRVVTNVVRICDPTPLLYIFGNKICLNYFVYTSSEGKSIYTYTQAHMSLHCSTLRQVPKSNGLILLICSFVASKSILFDLNYAKIIFRLQICINDNVHI